MTAADKHRGRPLPGTASNVIRDDDTTTVAEQPDTTVRCRRCRHPLTATGSVRLGLGPVCRHIVMAVVA